MRIKVLTLKGEINRQDHMRREFEKIGTPLIFSTVSGAALCLRRSGAAP